MAVILVVEDDPHILRVVSLWLSRNGHSVCESRNGRHALQRLRAGGVDLLISDINMPAISGLELLASAAAENVLPRGVIVLSSRCDQKEITEEVKTYGAVVHPKPFSPSRLIRVVEEKLIGPAAPAAPAGRT